MPIRINPDYETYNDLQVMYLDAVQVYFIVAGLMKEFRVGENDYAPRGEVYLYQISPDDDAAENDIKAMYDRFASVEGSDMPPYDELTGFNGYICVKAKYHIGRGQHSERAILFDEIIPLQVEDQLTFDDDGNIVKASVFD